MVTWNGHTHSLTYERFYYCQSLGLDVLALTKPWRNVPKFVDGTVHWTYSIAKKNDITGLPVFDKDKADDVGILLSAKPQRKYLLTICWVRLKGPTVNLFIVAVYICSPCKSMAGTTYNTMAELRKLLKGVPNSYCTVLLGGFNEQLASGVVNGITEWGHGEASPHAVRCQSGHDAHI